MTNSSRSTGSPFRRSTVWKRDRQVAADNPPHGPPRRQSNRAFRRTEPVTAVPFPGNIRLASVPSGVNQHGDHTSLLSKPVPLVACWVSMNLTLTGREMSAPEQASPAAVRETGEKLRCGRQPVGHGSLALIPGGRMECSRRSAFPADWPWSIRGPAARPRRNRRRHALHLSPGGDPRGFQLFRPQRRRPNRTRRKNAPSAFGPRKTTATDWW